MIGIVVRIDGPADLLKCLESVVTLVRRSGKHIGSTEAQTGGVRHVISHRKGLPRNFGHANYSRRSDAEIHHRVGRLGADSQNAPSQPWLTALAAQLTIAAEYRSSHSLAPSSILGPATRNKVPSANDGTICCRQIVLRSTMRKRGTCATPQPFIQTGKKEEGEKMRM